jgi:hypothetical protein
MQRPIARSLFLCDQVIVDRDSGKPTLVGLFESIRCSAFPSLPRSFDVYAVLTDGQGRMSIDVVISHLATEEQIAVQSGELFFPDPLFRQQVRFRFKTVSFTEAGSYVVALLAEGEVVTDCRFEVRLSED